MSTPSAIQTPSAPPPPRRWESMAGPLPRTRIHMGAGTAAAIETPHGGTARTGVILAHGGTANPAAATLGTAHLLTSAAASIAPAAASIAPATASVAPATASVAPAAASVAPAAASVAPAAASVAPAAASASAPALPCESGAYRSIFHEPWWLDITTGGRWGTAKVMHGAEVLGEMPYYEGRVGLWRVSHLPPLTRTLGPLIKPAPASANPGQSCHHRVAVTTQLIEQMPHFDSFSQVFDPTVQDALAFSLQGFNVTVRYTFRLAAHLSQAQAWNGLRGKTRSLIRSAEKVLKVATIDAPDEFLAFYAGNLAARSRSNAYGASVMHELVHAFVARRAGRLLGAYDAQGRLVAAVGLVWDQHTMYYLLSSRERAAHSGSISLLIWNAMQSALASGLTFDFDGFANPASCHFLAAFGGALHQRIGVERLSTAYSVVRTLKRRLSAKADQAFTPNM
jgi:hypothetical protein